MDWLEIFNNLLFDYTLRTVALGTAAIGLVSGTLGAFALLRRQSLLGDAMSHAALPGVVGAFLLTRSKAPIVLIIGAMIVGWLGTLVVMAIVRNSRIKQDSALGLVLSVFFGFGLMLLTYTQRLPDARQSGLDTFLFGQAATMLQRDVITIFSIGGIALLLMVIFWKEFKLLTFDADFAATLGFPVRLLDILLTTLFVIAIVVGLQAVGVVLMSAMVVAPAAAARQWTDRLGVMVVLAGLFGAFGGLMGAVVSSVGRGLSTGPVVVLCVSAIVLVSLFFAPNRGLTWNWLKQQRNRRLLQLETVLSHLYRLAAQHGDFEYGHSIATLRAVNFGQGGIRRTLQALVDQGWVAHRENDTWALTPTGLIKARQILQQTSLEEVSK